MRKYKVEGLEGFPFVAKFRRKLDNGEIIETKYIISGFSYSDGKRMLIEYVDESDLLVVPPKGEA